MRNTLLILPFLALLFAAFGALLGSSFAEQAIIFKSIGWGGAALLILAWVWIDRAGFKNLIGRKGAKYGASSGVVVILGISVIVAIAIITSKPRFDKSIDLSRDKTNTLSEQTLKVIENLEKKGSEAKVVAYFSDQGQEGQFKDLINLYLRAGAKLNIEYINSQREPLKAQADNLTNANTVIVRLGAQENRVTTFTEEKITNAISNSLKEGSKKIVFTKGHGEGQLTGNEATGFDILVQELKNNRYDVSDVNLLETTAVPEGTNALIIAGPKYDFKDVETKAVEDFINKGGNLLVMVNAMVNAPQINTLTEKFGFKFNNDFIIMRPDDPRTQLIGQNNAIINEFDDMNPVTKDFAKRSNVAVLFRFTRTLSEIVDNPAKFKVSLIGKTSSEAGVKLKNVSSQNDLKSISPDRIEQGSFAALASATGKVGEKEVRLLAAGSTEFANNQGAQAAEHRDLFLNMISYLSQDDDFITIRPVDPTKSTLSISSSGAMLNLKFISFVYPFIFLGIGMLYWMRRRSA
ncbi:MAG: GldG family protein [Proteobacteria bacterium]|nr:GldG family protein [Pseudomonadota bacterium]